MHYGDRMPAVEEHRTPGPGPLVSRQGLNKGWKPRDREWRDELPWARGFKTS